MEAFEEKMKEMIRMEFARRRNLERNSAPLHMGVGFPVYDENELYGALDSLLDLRLSQGERVQRFEREYSSYLGLDNGCGIAVNSGSSANLLVLSAMVQAGLIKRGEEVIVPAATFATVSSPLYQLGLVPVYVDSESSSWNMDPAEVEKAISPKSKVIMVVHNLGFPAQMDELLKIAKSFNLLVLEDCCEAHGAVYRGRRVGSIGDFSTLSFFVAHNITTGEGGMVFAQKKDHENLLRSLREFGRMIGASSRYKKIEGLGDYDTRYIFERLGFNIRMTDFVAAMGRVQLKKLESLNKIRRANAAKLRELVGRYGKFLSTLEVEEGSFSAYYGFPIILNSEADFSRNEICQHFEANGIETRPNMGGCLPDQPGFASQNHRVVGALPVARNIRDRALFVGVHSGLTSEHFDLFEQTLSTFFKNR